MSRRKKILLAALTMLLAGFSLWFLLQVKSHGGGEKAVEPDLESEDMVFRQFDKDRKTLEVHVRQNRKGKGDRLLHLGIRAVLFKKGKMDEDIIIEGEEGSSLPGFSEFIVEKNARIYSPSGKLDLKSKKFVLKNLEVLISKNPVDFQYEHISGLAKRGVEFYLKDKDARMYDVEGQFKVDNRMFFHKEETLFFDNDQHVLLFDRNEYLKTDETYSHANRFHVEFNSDLSHLNRILAIENSELIHTRIFPDRPGEVMTVHYNYINSFYNSEGKLERMELHGGWHGEPGYVLFEGSRKKTTIQAGTQNLYLDTVSGRLDRVEGLTCTIEQNARERFTFFSQKVFLYLTPKGDIDRFSGEFNCRLDWMEKSCYSHLAGYEGKTGLFHLEGPRSRVEKDDDRFVSPDFYIDTRARRLYTASGVQATLHPADKSESLFLNRPVFAVSRKLEMDERKGSVLFQEDVRLFQDQTEVVCRNLQFVPDGEDMVMSASGNAVLNGRDTGGESYKLQGESLDFHSGRQQVEVRRGKLATGGRFMESRTLWLILGEKQSIEAIRGRGEAKFSGSDMEGNAEEIDWTWSDETLVMRKNAKVKQKGVISEGDTLFINLKENLIKGEARGD